MQAGYEDNVGCIHIMYFLIQKHVMLPWFAEIYNAIFRAREPTKSGQQRPIVILMIIIISARAPAASVGESPIEIGSFIRARIPTSRTARTYWN